MQVTYSFYVDSYGGDNVPEPIWENMEQKAESRLEQYTFGRMPEEWDEAEWANMAKCAVCEMVEAMYVYDKRDGKTSENNDGYSVCYDVSENISKKLYDIAYVYLSNTGLMDFLDGDCL